MNARRGYSLIELLVVIGIIGVLLGLLIPAVQNVRRSALRTSCQNKLKQIALACHDYHNQHGTLPVAASSLKNKTEGYLSWMVHLLPFMGETALWQQSVKSCADYPVVVHEEMAKGQTPNHKTHPVYAVVVKAYVCPMDNHINQPLTTPKGDFVAFASYLGVAGSFKMIDSKHMGFSGALANYEGISFKHITDGLSNTLVIGERPPPLSLQAGQWYSTHITREAAGGPNGSNFIPGIREFTDYECSLTNGMFGPGRLDNPCDRIHFWSQHGGGANFAFADGSVRFMPYSTAKLLLDLASVNGGETISALD